MSIIAVVLFSSVLAAASAPPAGLEEWKTLYQQGNQSSAKGDIRAAQVLRLDGKSARTLADQRVTIDVRGGKVFLNDTVQVTKTDVLATNGVIHVIDKVLVPKS